jgi:hypothetical protein
VLAQCVDQQPGGHRANRRLELVVVVGVREAFGVTPDGGEETLERRQRVLLAGAIAEAEHETFPVGELLVERLCHRLTINHGHSRFSMRA